MTIVALTPVTLVAEAFSATTPLSGGVAPTTAADGVSIPASAFDGGADHCVVRILDSGSAATITVAAGVNPPGVRKGLGALVQAFAASEERMLLIEHARHAQLDGSVTITTSDTNPKFIVYKLPKVG